MRLVLLFLGIICLSRAFKPAQRAVGEGRVARFGSVGGALWGSEDCLKCRVLGEAPLSLQQMDANLIPVSTFNSLGDYNPVQPTPEEYEDFRRKAEFNRNVGRAMETLRNQLPYVFSSSNLDFTIFAEQITVTDHRSNRAAMPKSIYVAAVKSLRMAGALSTLFPSMNVRKIEYIKENGFIQCLVDVVLPDTVRVDGQAVWQGMFYFGLNEDGLIDSHVFDRQITNFSPQAQIPKMPWLRSAVTADFGVAQGRLVYNKEAADDAVQWPDLLVCE
jgi:hypothetical protein